MKLSDLNDTILIACPIVGINSAGVIWFRPEATTEQRAAAQALMDAHIGEVSD